MTKKKTAALDRCQEARRIWLNATSLGDLDRAELLYREALNSKSQQQKREANGGEPLKKKKKKSVEYAELKPQDYRKAGEQLSLLYCQSGRTLKAKKGLEYLGFQCRLAERVLDYPFPLPSSAVKKKPSKRKHSSSSSPSSTAPPCAVYDNFLNNPELDQLKSVFENPKANYWTSHQYQVEPPSPYFSYCMPLRQHNHPKLEKRQNINDDNEDDDEKLSFIYHLVQKIWKLPELNRKFPLLSKATYVEMWAHNRPHSSGHQCHFDSDDEGRGGVRNPIVSTILYITADGGGPSLVTNQRLDSTHLASKGWLSHPKQKRLVAFDGRVLHGVVPGKGVPKTEGGRRVTLMFAFWKKIQVRNESTPGSARPFPFDSPKIEWAKALMTDCSVLGLGSEDSSTITNDSPVQEQQPIELDTVYETLDGHPWRPKDGMLDYEQVFQGF